MMKAGVHVLVEEPVKLKERQTDDPKERARGQWSCSLPRAELEAGTPGIQLTLFIPMHSHYFQSSDMLLDEKIHLPIPMPLKRAGRGWGKLTFQHYFFQDVHEVLLGDATQGREL